MARGYCKLSQQVWASHQHMASMICLNILSLWGQCQVPSSSPPPTKPGPTASFPSSARLIGVKTNHLWKEDLEQGVVMDP